MARATLHTGQRIPTCVRHWRSLLFDESRCILVHQDRPGHPGLKDWLRSRGELVRLGRKAENYAREFRDLVNRWDLYTLRAPYLPEPMQTQDPVLLRHQADFLARGAGKLLYLSANAPAPDRDASRAMLTNSKAPPAYLHLREWHALVTANNKSKKSILHFGRLFRLQHYWRVVNSRWGAHLHGRIQKLQRAFSELLQASSSNPEQGFDTIRNDLKLIARLRGSRNWCSTTNISDLF
jgi:hypothetical protein